MSAVQPFRLLGGDEELGTVRVFPGVSHRHPSSSIVLQLEVLVFKLVTIDTLAWNTENIVSE